MNRRFAARPHLSRRKTPTANAASTCPLGARAALLAVALSAGTAACARGGAPELAPPASASAARAGPPAGDGGGAAAVNVATTDAAAASAAPIDASARSAGWAAAEADTETLAAAGPPPARFIDEARLVFTVGACGAPLGADVDAGALGAGATGSFASGSGAGDRGSSAGTAAARFDPAVVARHCEELGRAYAEYKKTWVDVAEPFLASLRPKDLPPVVVYPFGGGDLLTALATFPDATELTTISLEPAGDVRGVDALRPEQLSQELAVHRSHLERLFEKAHSRTDNLEKESKTAIPGEILFALAALVVHGDVPVGLRYFRLRPDGGIAYVTQADIDEQAHHPKAQRALFDDAELRFRSATDPSAPVRVLRHIAYNLDDEHLRSDPRLLRYLDAQPKVAVMTKAASHLLWNDHFALIRSWLLDHTDWMISDSTGIPPRFAEPAGFAQDTYGRFDGPALFGLYDDKDGSDFRHLFASEPARSLGFRYGYPDRDGHAHLIVTRRQPREILEAGPPDAAPGPR